MKSAYDFIKDNVRENLQKNMIEWRSQDAVTKLDKPTDIGRARNLGYKDKKGVIVFRVRVPRGGRKRQRRRKGRRSKRQTIRKTLKMSYQWVAEQRAAKNHTNLEVLNSYKIAKDGKYYFFEVIMVDPQQPEIKNDPNFNWIVDSRKRVFRGLTSAAKKSRGLRKKSKNLKVRPSGRARSRQGK